ncbi:MAG: ATP-binding protein [Oscillospiraceae bacterium]|nr:ATP-binding protein [Oscillospiraceae bacterium]
MAYDGAILRRATARYEEDRRRRNERFRSLRKSLYLRQPRLEAIDRELSQTMAHIIADGLRRGTDPRAPIAALREANLALQRERGELLHAMGYPVDCLVEKPACETCGDSGWVGGRMCTCLRAYYTRAQNAELSRMLDLGTQSFDSFDATLYSDTETFNRRKTARENMYRNYDVCVDYARHFPSATKNLLLSGDPGLGKTFLSACIAREVSEKGFSVVYDTASHVFSRFEAQRFDYSDSEADGDVHRFLHCDLLILDDLGTEMNGNLVTSALYQIVNTRLSARRCTVISTNLAPNAIGERYGASILSRIWGEYQFLLFYGEDIRKLKKR